MTWNSFGRILRLTTFGESHGEAIGCILDGCPAGIELSASDIQPYLDERRPGQSRFTTQRQEKDRVRILSGVFEGRTLGSPIALLIENSDARSKDYDKIASAFRPGHADWVYLQKYGIRDHRGGGRSSARETAMRVAAGAVARKVLPARIVIRAAVGAIGSQEASRDNWNWDQTRKNPLFCPDAAAVEDWQNYLDALRKRGSSCGALIECEALRVPVGLGAPLYGKLEADLASAMMSINAAKGFELGSGFALARAEGDKVADEMRSAKAKASAKTAASAKASAKTTASAKDGVKDGVKGKVKKSSAVSFLANHSGGINAGISTGQDIVVRVPFKPTSSIRSELKTINTEGEDVSISTPGRHDPCVGIRAVPIVEAMMALVLADHYLLFKTYKD